MTNSYKDHSYMNIQLSTSMPFHRAIVADVSNKRQFSQGLLTADILQGNLLFLSCTELNLVKQGWKNYSRKMHVAKKTTTPKSMTSLITHQKKNKVSLLNCSHDV